MLKSDKNNKNIRFCSSLGFGCVRMVLGFGCVRMVEPCVRIDIKKKKKSNKHVRTLNT